MASFNLFDGSTAPRTLVGGEFGFIGQLGALSTSGVAITASGAVDVTVQGALQATGNALLLNGDSLNLFVGQQGVIGSTTSDTVRAAFTGSIYVSNDGALHSGSDALDIRASDTGGVINILNAGTISGASDGIVTNSGDGATRIVNTGSILGVDGGIDHLGGAALFINRGEVSGSQYGYSGADGVDTVQNSGSIFGGVFGEAGADVVLNSGTIDRVDLGAGDDRYDGRRGFVDTEVLGGLGKDDLRGGDGYDPLYGGAGADVLRGRGGDDLLEGGSGADVLYGGPGDDLLRGGTAADTFRFGTNHGADTISDLSSVDKIDLTALDLVSFSADVRGAIRAVKGGSVIDLSDDFGLTISLDGVRVAELTASDFVI